MLPTDKGSQRRETVWGVLGRRAGAGSQCRYLQTGDITSTRSPLSPGGKLRHDRNS